MAESPGDASRLSPAARAALAATEAVLAEVLPLDRCTPARRADLVERKVHVMGAFVRHHVPFYRDLGLPSRPELCDFPVVDKATLMLGLPATSAEPDVGLEDLRGWVPADERDRQFELFRGRYYVRRTSGTTGVVGFFLWDGPAAAAVDAAQARFLTRLEELPRPMVAVSPVVALPPLSGVLYGMHSIPIGTGLVGTVERLNQLRPRSIIGSPAFVAALAAEQADGRLRIAPEAVQVWTERCLPHQRRRITEAWGVDAGEPYGTSETSAIAVRCPEGNFHVLADMVHVELLDDGGREVAEGQTASQVLVTRLCGPVQPIIRYVLGDAVVRGPDECPCGRPFPTLAEIRGRHQARMWLPAVGGGAVSVSVFVLIPLLEDTPGLVRYQLRYERPGCLEVAVATRGAFSEPALRSALEGALRDAGATATAIRIVAADLPDSPVAAPPGTKDHHVVCHVTQEDAERYAREHPA